MQRSYPTSDPLQNENSLRQRLASVMVDVHLISPDLARYHLAQIPDEEIARLVQMYVRLGVRDAAELEQAELFA